MPIIRRAETRDLPALAALAAKLFSGEEAEHFAEFSQLLPCADAALFLCEEGGAPAGFVIYTNQRTLYITPDEHAVKRMTLVSG